MPEKSDQARIIAEGGEHGAVVAKNHDDLSQNHKVQPVSFVYRVEVGVAVETLGSQPTLRRSGAVAGLVKPAWPIAGLQSDPAGIIPHCSSEETSVEGHR